MITKKKAAIVLFVILMVITVGMYIKPHNDETVQNGTDSATKPQVWYCITGDNECWSSPTAADRINYNNHYVWVTVNISTGERVNYMEYGGSNYFYDRDEIARNHSIYPVFSNGIDRIVVREGGDIWSNIREKYIPPYTKNTSIKYGVFKVVFTPDFRVYYWDNSTLTTLVPSSDDVLTTVRSDDNKLILVKEYHDNFRIVRYWQLNVKSSEE